MTGLFVLYFVTKSVKRMHCHTSKRSIVPRSTNSMGCSGSRESTSDDALSSAVVETVTTNDASDPHRLSGSITSQQVRNAEAEVTNILDDMSGQGEWAEVPDAFRLCNLALLRLASRVYLLQLIADSIEQTYNRALLRNEVNTQGGLEVMFFLQSALVQTSASCHGAAQVSKQAVEAITSEQIDAADQSRRHIYEKIWDRCKAFRVLWSSIELTSM